jgi:hypothetical protein
MPGWGLTSRVYTTSIGFDVYPKGTDSVSVSTITQTVSRNRINNESSSAALQKYICISVEFLLALSPVLMC